MRSFLRRFGALILSILSGFDRLRFRGESRLLNNVRGVNSYLYRQDLLIKEFPAHAQRLSRQLIQGTEALAAAEGLRIHYLNSPNIDKEAVAQDDARQQGRHQGRVALLSCVESCSTYRVRKNKETGFIEIHKEEGRCQHFYHYFHHEQLGPCYVRVQTWFPFVLDVGLNGRSWLYQQLQREGIPYRCCDNILLEVADWPRAQQLLEEQLQTDWPTLLGDLTRSCNPLTTYLDQHAPYYWTTAQSEWATDVLFHSAADLSRWYDAGCNTASWCSTVGISCAFWADACRKRGSTPGSKGRSRGTCASGGRGGVPSCGMRPTR